MSERLMLISSDGHIGPPAENYREYMDPKYRDDFDEWFAAYIPMWLTNPSKAKNSIKQESDADFNMWSEFYKREFEARAADIPWGIEGKWDPRRRLEALDMDGVAADVMFPDDQSANSPPFLGLARNYCDKWDRWSPVQRREGARAYNRWLAEFCSRAPERLLGIAMVGSLVDVEGAIETVRWAKENGVNGGVFLPVQYYDMEEPFWNDRRYEPLWATCAELGMPLHTHVGPGSPFYSEDPVEGTLLWAIESMFWVHRPLWFFILSGILERHPGLKLVFTEQGVEWVVGAVMGMDMTVESKLMPIFEKGSRLPLKPSEYFRRQCWIGATNTDAIGWMDVEQRYLIGVDRLMWGSDYPHLESAWPHTREKLHDLVKGLPADEVKAMIGGNAIECYGLDVAKLMPTVERIGPHAEEIITV